MTFPNCFYKGKIPCCLWPWSFCFIIFRVSLIHLKPTKLGVGEGSATLLLFPAFIWVGALLHHWARLPTTLPSCTFTFFLCQTQICRVLSGLFWTCFWFWTLHFVFPGIHGGPSKPLFLQRTSTLVSSFSVFGCVCYLPCSVLCLLVCVFNLLANSWKATQAGVRMWNKGQPLYQSFSELPDRSEHTTYSTLGIGSRKEASILTAIIAASLGNGDEQIGK